jgi:predicted dehydrogenase
MPAMCLRFWPEWAWLKHAIDDQRFGKVLAARFRRVAEPPAWGQTNFFNGPESGGALVDLHIHDTDFVQFCFGRPKSVFSTGYDKFSGAIDHVVTQYQVDNGAIVHAEGGWAMTPGFGFNMSFTVNFEKATADYDIARPTETLKLAQHGAAPQIISLDQPDGYIGELNHMIESILNNTAPTVVTAQDGLSAVEICAAEEQSVRTGRIITLT